MSGAAQAYLEDIIVHEAWPESLNLQGVSDFDPNDPLYWAMEHCQSERPKPATTWKTAAGIMASGEASTCTRATKPQAGKKRKAEKEPEVSTVSSF
ncbi:hypothetical protein J4E83_006353 [Alternaria metachromatica]|uniref:uncharacterized protein n=1 Tax=Alternaria metachromatica TaxID=283354 RepID=UPI0020C3ECAE|nr:uncharacterized protein J4E83_006353 [Alternaria metachromatica]KAI4616773.1 hypothetical protein J4E83_006353 [Alternaria metachromatica]